MPHRLTLACKYETFQIVRFGMALAVRSRVLLGFGGRTVNFLSAAHQLAWAQHPEIWLCESCAILWLVLRVVRLPWVRAGVLLVLCGLMLNGLVIAANSGAMPVVGMPSAVHPVSPMWEAATSKTRLPFLADHAQLGLFSIGDLVMLFGGVLIVVATCLHRALKMKSRIRKPAERTLRDTTGARPAFSGQIVPLRSPRRFAAFLRKAG
jgi:hypothetical protein